MPGVFASSVLVFVFSLGFYITPALLGRGRTLMVAEYIETRILQLGQWGPGSAMGVALLFAVVALLAFLGRRYDLTKAFGAR